MADKAEWALRRFCLECQGGDAPSVAACADRDCLLFDLRPRPAGADCGAADGAGGAEPALRPANAPARAIRRFCLVCAGSRREVRHCDAGKTCALWSFRFGVHPATFKRVLARRKKSRGSLSLPGL